MKECTKCNSTLSLSNFYYQKHNDRYNSWCKQCCSIQRKQRYINTKEDTKLVMSEYRKLNRDTLLIKKEEYRKKNRDILASKQRLYARLNSDTVRRLSNIRKSRLRKATPSFANKESILRFYDKAKSLTMETGVRYEVDHIIPISKGGLHYEYNLRVITMEENRKKGAKMPRAIEKVSSIIRNTK